MAETNPPTSVHVPTGLNLKTRFFAATAGAWQRLAAVESAVLRDEISGMGIEKPIYVIGVPRAGTTITTEMLERHPQVTSHRYSDFPNIYTPFWRNWLAARTRRDEAQLVERSHGDRIMVTPESPEAVEEVIWMRFFKNLHDPNSNQVLDDTTDNPRFESFYRDHVLKLLLVRGASRYLAKGNYNITRLAYIHKLLPDARFVVVVRHPVNHVASLVKQDRRFHEASREDSRVPGQLARSGHFEFGPHQRALNTGNAEVATRIQESWKSGDLAVGWAEYWNSVYDFLLDQLHDNKTLSESVRIVRYEDLCGDPETLIRQILEHCDLSSDNFESIIEEYAGQISEPTYYKPEFTSKELEDVTCISRSTATRFGYEL